jgi:signal transduction histidine kinase
MTDRKVFFPLILFGIFLLLIAIAGSFQITIIKRNMEGLLREEGENLFRSLGREIEMNMEYLTILETSPSIVTPNLLNVLAYDEAIADDLYYKLTRTAEPHIEKLSVQNILVLNAKGRELMQKGSIKVDGKDVRRLLGDKEQAVVTHKDRSLLMGFRLPGRLVFLRLDVDELESFRKKYILKTIIESEGKRLDAVAINVYDGSGKLYLGSGIRPEAALKISKPLNPLHFPGYSMEIFISNKLAVDTYRRTSAHFLTILLFLILGGAAGIYVIFQADRKHAERLSEMEKEMAMKERLISLGRLASGMAHEIRNPLNAMSMSIQRLKREFVPEVEKKEEYYQFLDIVRGELQRVNKIVQDFLLSTRAGEPMEQARLSDIIHEVVTMLRERADSKGVTIEDHKGEPIELRCQRERLKQVFYNLIINSIEAMNEGGTIHISSALLNATASTRIEDDGPGIKKEDLHKVFEYHYTTKDKGMGLGLPISYMIVKDHGGDIRVTSGEHKGTTFTITLPVKNEEP